MACTHDGGGGRAACGKPGAHRVALADGSSVESATQHASGSPQRPLTDAQLHAKFFELARRTLDECAAAALFEECLLLERIADVAHLRRHWAPAGYAR